MRPELTESPVRITPANKPARSIRLGVKVNFCENSISGYSVPTLKTPQGRYQTPGSMWDRVVLKSGVIGR